MPDSKADTNYERMAKVIAITPYMKHLGMEFIEGREGYAKLRLRFQKENTTAGDALHGGAIASLIDTTGAMAAWTTAEILSPRYFGSTVGVNVNYLSGVIGEDAFAEGQGDHLLRRAGDQRRRQAPGPGHRRLSHNRAGS